VHCEHAPKQWYSPHGRACKPCRGYLYPRVSLEVYISILIFNISILIFDIHLPSIENNDVSNRVFHLLLQMIPRMEDCLMEGSEEDVAHMAKLLHNSVVPLMYF